MGAQAVILFAAGVGAAALAIKNIASDRDCGHVVAMVFGTIAVIAFYASKSVWKELDYE